MQLWVTHLILMGIVKKSCGFMVVMGWRYEEAGERLYCLISGILGWNSSGFLFPASNIGVQNHLE